MRLRHSALRINKTMKKKYAGAPRCLPWGDPGTRNDADASQRCCGQTEQETLPADVQEGRQAQVRLRRAWWRQPLPSYVQSGWEGQVGLCHPRRVCTVPNIMRDKRWQA